jgi:DNA processing protein
LIKSFRDNWLKDFYFADSATKKVPADIRDRLFRKLQLIDDATSDLDLRAPTSNHFEKLSGRELSSVGLTIISGMALGIDAACHEGALLAGAKTIAVLGTGCDIVYPARHQGLAHGISRQGLLLSEFPLRVRAAPHHFPRRNRVVTGLSLGTIVVEAALKSGSLISARCAMEQGREVFAIPGAINNRHARGCHQLIRDGATLVENAQDVLDQLSFVADRALAITPVQPLTDHQQRVESILDGDPQNADRLEAQLSLSIDEVLCALVELEVLGLVAQERGGYVSLKPDDV